MSYTFTGATGNTTVTGYTGSSQIDIQMSEDPVLVGRTVKTIANSAFNGKLFSLPSLELPTTLNTIGSSAYNGAAGITGPINLSELTSLVSIGYAAFTGCSGLNGPLNLSGLTGLTGLNIQTFKGCSQLSSLTLPTSLTILEDSIFLGCSGLTGPLDLDGLTTLGSIGGDAFNGCSQLTSLTLPPSLSSLGGQSFFGCSGLNGSLDLSGLTSLVTINVRTFQSCSQLDFLILPPNLTTLETFAFGNCSGLSSIYFQQGCTLQSSSFSNLPNATVYSYNNDEFTIGSGSAVPFSTIVNPLSSFFPKWRLYDYPYPSQSSYYEQGITSFTLNYIPGEIVNFYTYSPTTVTSSTYTVNTGGYHSNFTFVSYTNNRATFSIQLNAGATFLTLSKGTPGYTMNLTQEPEYTSTTFGGNTTVTGWGGSTLINKQIGAPDSGVSGIVIAIEDDAFLGYTFSLPELILPTTLTTIGENAYRDATGITGPVNLSALTNLEFIGIGAFYGCYNLTGPLNLSLLTNLQTIGSSAFQDCNQLTLLTLPSTLTTLGSAGFRFCRGLTGPLDLDGLTNLQTINNVCFQSCTQLTSLTLPSSIESIGDFAFDNCIGLTGTLDLALLTNLQTIGISTFRDCSQLTSLTLPSSIESIGESAFQNCIGLNGTLDLALLTNLQTIDSSTFQNCSQLTSLTLPSSLTTLNANAFLGCTGLSSIYFQQGCTLQSSSFSNLLNATVYSYNNDEFTIDSDSAVSFSTIVNPLSSDFPTWQLYDYPYPATTTKFGANTFPFTLNYHEVTSSIFYTYSPISKTDYVIVIDNVDVTNDFTQTYDAVNKRTEFTGEIPPFSLELYIDGNGPMLLNDTLAIIQNSVEITDVDVTVPFTIEPDHSPYTLYYDGTSTALPTSQQFNQFEFTIFENNVRIEGDGVSSLDLTLSPYFKESRMFARSIIYTLEPDVPVMVQLVDATTGEPMSEPVESTGSYYIGNLRDGSYYLRIVNDQLNYDHTIIADICFVKGTIVKTDQGLIEIDKITNQTLNRKPITVTKTIHHDPYLVKVSAGAFGNYPTRDTYMSLKHHIMMGVPVMAKNLINGDTITEVPYDGEYLYNVLVDTHTMMSVHGMLVETLDPNSIVGLFYRAKLSPKQKNKMIRMINAEPERAKRMLMLS